MAATDLTVKPQKQKHDEKKDGPEGGQGHHRHSFWISDESQARTYRGRGEGERMWLKKNSSDDTYSPWSVLGLGSGNNSEHEVKSMTN